MNSKSLCLSPVESLQIEVKEDRGCLELTKSSGYINDDEFEHTITYISVLTVYYNSLELKSKDTSEHTWKTAKMKNSYV